ncbi:polysaccharide deacetylase [Clostridium bowmanii]|uniref:polysaccharide deacetylase family protein n=1 Tax=Clostridium bowmanii TaxID=132925 RepID=UPI001C0B6FE5|nr:polysaccharide deacetylase family protein [Clostridium bowmanii]MBU3188475.1 polysaccharide deacetylase [Clostridium bowmanii]MCA1072860.1 polysaccharide deacetylase [Clostridium bowmanii]
MRNSKIKKKRPLGLLLVKIFIFTLCISSLVQAAVGQATVVRGENESTLLLQQISQIRSHNKKLKLENKNLQSGIIKKEASYKEKMANTKIAYLTFDDGPSENTVEILRILKQYDVKATFFVNGHPNYSYLYKQISDEGHLLANHTYSHEYKDIYNSPDNFKNDTEKLDRYLTSVTGKEPNYILRFPGGSNNTISNNFGGNEIMTSVIKEMNASGYKYFDWNVDSTDASTYCQDRNKIVQAVLSESSQTKHAIILMHDLAPKITTVQALPEIIEGLKNQGFIFDVLSKKAYAPQFTVVK